MALTLYGFARSRVSRTLWMLEELGRPYEHVVVGKGADGTGSEAYRRLNPNAQVPTLVDGGLVLWESIAINLYLAKEYGRELGPQSSHEDARMTQWSIWAITSLEDLTHEVFVHSLRNSPDQRDPDRLHAAQDSLRRPLAVLDQALADGSSHLVGGRFTVADLNVACMLFYLRGSPDTLHGFPGVARFYAKASERPAFKRMLALRGEAVGVT